MLIADAHLDLAYNAIRGREVLQPAAQQTADHEGIPSVGLPDLRRGNIGLICATIFCEPENRNTGKGYRTADDAHAMALAQYDWYSNRASENQFRFITRPSDLPKPDAPAASAIPMILLLEGADAFRTPADVPTWFDRGLRIVGLAWRQTRMAGGTGAPGPLTSEGRDIVRALDAVHIIHDTSHLAEESFWQLLEMSDGPIMASHSNCRSIVPTDRQLSDEMIRAIVKRNGVIGINFYDKFLLPPDQYKTRRAQFSDLLRHINHICDIAGNRNHVAIGTDMDGGFGRDQIPQEIKTSADLPLFADYLSKAGFGDGDVRGIMGANWVSFFQKSLPT